MAIVPRQQIEADEEVITYFLNKKSWNCDEFAALYCGINPFVWKSVKYSCLDGPEIPEVNRQAIEDVLTLIEDRIEAHNSISNRPYKWRNLLPRLGLTAPAWMSLIIEPDSVQENVDAMRGERNSPRAMMEKGLSTTERNTLLTIIAALCDYSAIKPDNRGAANQIAKMTEEIGATVSDDTVRRWLKLIPDALATRMK